MKKPIRIDTNIDYYNFSLSQNKICILFLSQVENAALIKSSKPLKEIAKPYYKEKKIRFNSYKERFSK